MKEQLSKLIHELLNFCRANGSLDVFHVNLLTTLAILIQDSSPSVRQNAIDVIAALHVYANECRQSGMHSSGVDKFINVSGILVT